MSYIQHGTLIDVIDYAKMIAEQAATTKYIQVSASIGNQNKPYRVVRARKSNHVQVKKVTNRSVNRNPRSLGLKRR